VVRDRQGEEGLGQWVLQTFEAPVTLRVPCRGKEVRVVAYIHRQHQFNRIERHQQLRNLFAQGKIRLCVEQFEHVLPRFSVHVRRQLHPRIELGLGGCGVQSLIALDQPYVQSRSQIQDLITDSDANRSR